MHISFIIPFKVINNANLSKSPWRAYFSPLQNTILSCEKYCLENDMWPTPRFGHDWGGDQCRQWCQTIVFGRLKRYTTHERRSYYSNSTTNRYDFLESKMPPFLGLICPKLTLYTPVESKRNWKSAQTYTNSAMKNVLTDIKHLNKTLLLSWPL